MSSFKLLRVWNWTSEMYSRGSAAGCLCPFFNNDYSYLFLLIYENSYEHHSTNTGNTMIIFQTLIVMISTSVLGTGISTSDYTFIKTYKIFI